MGQVIKMADPPTNYHYSVYEHRLIGPDGILYTRAFIVLKNQYSIIVRYTRLHNYLGIYEGKVCRPITADGVNRARYVCMMLNYILVKHHYKYHIWIIYDERKRAHLRFQYSEIAYHKHMRCWSGCSSMDFNNRISFGWESAYCWLFLF